MLPDVVCVLLSKQNFDPYPILLVVEFQQGRPITVVFVHVVFVESRHS